MRHGTSKSTRNSGVCMKGEAYDSDFHSLDYYGRLLEVCELEYQGINIGASVSRISLGGDHATEERVHEETTHAPRARGLIHLTVHQDGYIDPYDEVPKLCTRAFKRVDNPGGFTWDLTPEPIQIAYWEEFKKQCAWNEKDDDFIYNHWWSRARRRYRDCVHYMKKPTIGLN